MHRRGRISGEVERLLGVVVYLMFDCLSWLCRMALNGVLWAVVVGYMACMFLTACGAKNDAHSTYPKLLQVVGIQGAYGDWCIDFMDTNGFTYHIDLEDGDFEVCEFYTCIMDDMGTELIADDQIVSMRYERVDLFK